MSAFAIDKDIPVPAEGGAGRPTIYPWPRMGHGDSVLIPFAQKDIERKEKGMGPPRFYQAARKWVARHRPTWKVVARTEGDAMRIWFVDPSKNGHTNGNGSHS